MSSKEETSTTSFLVVEQYQVSYDLVEKKTRKTPLILFLFKDKCWLIPDRASSLKGVFTGFPWGKFIWSPVGVLDTVKAPLKVWKVKVTSWL